MNDLTTQAKPTNPLAQFKQNLARLKEAGELDMLPANVSYESFRNAAVVAVTDNPSVLSCQPETLFKAIRKLAAAGLVPDGREAALVPFKTKDQSGAYVQTCQAMPMIFGLIKMARNSGEVSDIRAHIVYQGEVEGGQFRYTVGDRETLEHDPILFGEKGPAVAAYAIAIMKDGSIIREFMDAGEIDKVRRSGASQLNFEKGQRPTVSAEPKGIWADWWAEMWKKTVIRRLIKRLPMSADDMRRVSELDETRHELRDVTPAPTGPRQNLAQRLQEGPQEPVREVAGEVMPPEYDLPASEPEIDGHWTDDDPEDGIPGSKEWDQGIAAYKGGVPARMCPYKRGTQEAADWLGAWHGQRKADE